MRKLACAAAIAALVPAGSAGAAGPALAPHVYGVKISGASVPLFNATWLLARNGKIVVAGTAGISGNRITVHDLSGSLRCKPSQAVGTYSWKLSGKKRTLKRISDPCVGRRLILSVSYTRL